MSGGSFRSHGLETPLVERQAPYGSPYVIYMDDVRISMTYDYPFPGGATAREVSDAGSSR
jgi:hypothetical protein